MTAHSKNEIADKAIEARRAVMGLLAQSDTAAIERGLADMKLDVGFTDLREPEIGLVMLRGRMGGTGALFNFGEATVTRAAVQLASGERGFAYVLGFDSKKARLAAICDALWQVPGVRQNLERHVLQPLREKHDARLARERARTAATKVDFFTLVRGEDAQ